MNLGAPELLIILLVVLLLFGGAKLPKLARSLGQAQKEFKQGMDDSDKSEPAPSKSEPAAAKPAGETVTMSKADLEALIAEREAKARREAAPPAD
jgi:sec-independent protein translocase protein TatA